MLWLRRWTCVRLTLAYVAMSCCSAPCAPSGPLIIGIPTSSPWATAW